MADEFTTSRGVTVRFVGMATLLDKLNAQFTLPEPPFYEIKLATGGIERHAHDETTVQTDEERQALIDYQADCERIQREHRKKLTQLILMRGITFDGPPDDNWANEQEFLGIHVPTDALARRLHYIETEVIATVADVQSIILGVMRASTVNEEMVSQIEATFQHSIRESERDETERVDKSLDGTAMVLHDPVRDGARRVEDAQVSERV